jgi:murein DD-endopeptidase MepM/ murein hydrolase activator NlpD
MPYVDLCELLTQNSEPITGEPTPAAPTPSEHLVLEGETLSEIALLYGTTADVLAELNGLADAGALSIGMRLRLPEGGAAPVPTGQSPAVSGSVRLAAACSPDASEHILDLPAEASRSAILDGTLYLLAGGELYGLPLAATESADKLLQPSLIRPADRVVAGISLQELMDVAIEESSGTLVLLNKVGDLFGYQPSSGNWSVRMVAASVPGLWIDPQYLAITQNGEMTYALDVDNASVWRLPAGGRYPVLERGASSIARAVDLASMNGRLYLANANGTLADGGGRAYAEGVERLAWPADLASTQGGLLAIDGDGRRVVLLGEGGALDVSLRLPGMQRLRTAAADNGVVYAVAGNMLYRAAAQQEPEACPSVPYDNRWLFGNVDLDAAVPALTLPFDGGVLPSRPRSYPGARRMYRYGIHEGVDFYAGDAPGLSYGSPVAAIAPGTVIRIDHDFREITPEAYGPMMAEIEALHSTPEHYLDKLRGQQVWIEHAPGVVSRYSHLAGVAGDLQVGDTVVTGQFLGRVGVSGTSDGVYRSTAGYHLHWEIWVNGRYLGQGLTIPETMRIWNHLF